MQKFESLREMRMLPGFVEKVRRGRHQFKSIVGWYQFRETVPCSLSDCRTPHNRGYVVAIQAGGQIGHTNIGHVCGRHEFGQVFQDAHVAAEKFLDQQRLRQSLLDTLDELPVLRAHARELLEGPRGAQWLQRALGSLARACPAAVYAELSRRSSRGEATITRSRLRTEHDPPAPDGTHRGYITETVGVLAGIGCMATPHPKDTLTERILKPIEEFSQVSPDDLLAKGGTRRWFQDWRRRIAGDLEDVERKLKLAQSFFTESNLQQLQLLASSTSDRSRLAEMHWDEAAGLVQGQVLPESAASRPTAPVERRTVSMDRYGLAAARARLQRQYNKRKRKKKKQKAPGESGRDGHSTRQSDS